MKNRRWNIGLIACAVVAFIPMAANAVTLVLSSVESLIDSAVSIGVYKIEPLANRSAGGLEFKSTLIQSLKAVPPKELSEDQFEKCLSQLNNQSDDFGSKADRILVLFRHSNKDRSAEVTLVNCRSLPSLPAKGHSMLITHKFEILIDERELLKTVESRVKATVNKSLPRSLNGSIQGTYVRIPIQVERMMTRNSPNANILLGVPKDLEEASNQAFKDLEKRRLFPDSL